MRLRFDPNNQSIYFSNHVKIYLHLRVTIPLLHGLNIADTA